MLERMKQLVKENDICVLATAFESKPHCSLMAYACDDTGSEIFMATKRDSKKYRNLSRNPSVSLLIDTRARDLTSHRFETKALTVAGRYEPLAADAAKTAVKRLREHHSHLKDFLEDPDVTVFVVKAESFLLLEGVTEAHFETVS
jgi:nitroimidazol reductase NimA-like FMN-containing flavoprotein (pyridoxamine 5'-phosphate oxidase superfamily)